MRTTGVLVSIFPCITTSVSATFLFSLPFRLPDINTDQNAVKSAESEYDSYCIRCESVQMHKKCASRTTSRPVSRLLLELCLALAVCAVLTNPAACDRVLQRRVVAIGDVHGDVQQLSALLQMAGVVDREGKWIDTQNTVVVQVGDMLDRGPHDKAVMDYVLKLRDEAAAAGGRVVSLLGNHELMNLQGQYHYVHPESHEDFGGKHNRKREFSAAGAYGKWLRSLSVVHVEGTSLFVHAGLAPQFAALGVDKINSMAREALESGKRIDENHKIFGVHGPVWTRLLITDAMNGRCEDVRRSLEIIGAPVKRMIIGHTPQRSGRIESYCDDALIAIDVGLSKWMYGHLAALEILEYGPGDVELHEILPHTAIASDNSSNEAESEQNNEDGGGVKDPVAQAVNDPMVLQEMLELVQETKLRDKLRNEEALDKERHEEL